MASWPHADDDALLAELGAALRAPGPVPDEFLAAARGMFAWRTVNAELAIAELIFDSVCDPEPAGGTRSGGSARTLAFRTGEVTLEIEVTDQGVTGQLWPASDGRITAQTVDGAYDDTTVDAVGFFTLGPPPPGPVRLHARTAAYEIATSWITLA
jgi:hypothetical protein